MARDMGNVDAAAEILEQACQTLPRACRDLAMIYQNDSYDRKDEEKARTLYKKAYDGGDNIGCARLQQMGWYSHLKQKTARQNQFKAEFASKI